MALIVNSENGKTYVFVKDEDLIVLDFDSTGCNGKISKTSLKCDLADSQWTLKEESDKSSKNTTTTPSKILSVAVADNGDSLVACDSKNLIHSWTREQNHWKYVSTRRSVRKCQKVIFTHSCSEIILADRGGDVFVFPAINTSAEGKFILGHISFITDICMSSNDQFLASCDRDGKIRISSYPNCYNIHSYCLGHTQFVSSLNFASFNDQHILITGSGDGCIKLWDFHNGHEIASQHMIENQPVSSDGMDDVCNEVITDESQLSDIFAKEPSLKFSIQNLKVSKKFKVVSVLYHFLKKISIFKISDNKLEFVQDLALPALVFDVALFDNVLVVLLKSSPKVQCLWFKYDECCASYVQSKEIPSVISEAEIFFSYNTVVDNQFTQLMLFKKLFDDIDEDDCKNKKNKMA